MHACCGSNFGFTVFYLFYLLRLSAGRYVSTSPTWARRGLDVPNMSLWSFLQAKSVNNVCSASATGAQLHTYVALLANTFKLQTSHLIQRLVNLAAVDFVVVRVYTVVGVNWQRACRKQWRPTRLESECILGEGITVQFPDSRCTVLDQTLAGRCDLYHAQVWLW